MANRRTTAGLAGPIVLLYLGYLASAPTLTAVVRELFGPHVNWAEIGWGGTVVFTFMAVAGVVACAAAIRMLADTPRFPGIVAAPDSSMARKIDAVGATLIGFALLVFSLTSEVFTLGFFAPIIAGWVCVNAIRNYRSLIVPGRAAAAR